MKSSSIGVFLFVILLLADLKKRGTRKFPNKLNKLMKRRKLKRLHNWRVEEQRKIRGKSLEITIKSTALVFF